MQQKTRFFLKFAQYGQQDSNPVVTGLFQHLDVAALRWPASQSQSSCPYLKILNLEYLIAISILLIQSDYVLVWEPKWTLDVILWPDSLDSTQDCLHSLKAIFFCWHVLSILHIYFTFICQLIWAIDHNLWESCISLLKKLERKAHSKHIQELWNSTRNFFTSLWIKVLNFALAHSLFIEINVNYKIFYL